jgi:hypothetical protein
MAVAQHALISSSDATWQFEFRPSDRVCSGMIRLVELPSADMAVVHNSFDGGPKYG